MKDSVEVGMNVTGLQVSPLMSRKMLEGTEEFNIPETETVISIPSMRQLYVHESDQLGTLPPPTTMKGVLDTSIQKLKGNHPSVLIDKLGERLAFERSGVRLYEALISKCEAAIPEVSLTKLFEIRDDEASHFHLVRRTLEKIGADPTAQTPCADAGAVAAMGLIQVLSDPRTSVQQCVEAILIAELTDNAGWDLLIQLAEAAGLDVLVGEFSDAKRTEEGHLQHIQMWLEELVLQNKAVSIH